MKRILSALLTAVLVFTTLFGLSIFSEAKPDSNGFVCAAPDTENVCFSSDYAEIGKTISVVFNGRKNGELFYKWYLDNEQINNYSDSYTPVEGDLGRLMTVEVYYQNCTLAGKKSMLISNLPVVYIEVENRKAVKDKINPLNAQIRIQGNSEFNDSSILYTGKAEIKGRGNATWLASKKPYKLKLDSKANLFGMGKSKHWVLLSNPYDTSNLRNKLAYDLSGNMGLNYQQSVWVDVVMNGQVVGIYQLCEHIRIEENRVNITSWDDIAEDAAKNIQKKNSGIITKDDKNALIDQMTADLSWTTSDKVEFKGNTYTVSDYYDVPDITGGYLFEVNFEKKTNCFYTNNGQIIEIDKPEGISTDMKNYLNSYYNAFEDALYSDDYCTVYNGKKMRYTDFIDVDSFAKGIIVNEIFENCDFGKKSTWMSLDINGKIVYGPVWDMDYSTTYTFAKWNAGKPDKTGRNLWLKKMISDPVMMSRIVEIYWEYRYTDIANLLKDGGTFDTAYKKISDSAVNNDAIWQNTLTFEENSADMYFRLQTKINWLDKRLTNPNKAISSVISGAENEYIINSSAISFTADSDGIKVSSSLSPASISVYSDGNLIAEITSSDSPVIPASGTITAIAYDKNGKVIGGGFYYTNRYVKALKVTKNPTKTVYNAGEKLDLSGLVLTAEYSDGLTETVEPQLVYTYAKNTIGIQKYCYNRATEKIGNVYAVLFYKNLRSETAIQISPRENADEVAAIIANLPDDVSIQKDFRYIFEAQAAYNALSSSAKAKVSNASVLTEKMNAFDKMATETELGIIGGSVDGVFRIDAKNTIIAVVKGSAKKIITVDKYGASATRERDNEDIFSIAGFGDYEVWTVSQMTIDDQGPYSWRVSYNGMPSQYGKPFYPSELFADNKPVKTITADTLAFKGKDYKITACKYDIAETVTITENGKNIAVKQNDSAERSEITLNFKTAGKHTIDISYISNGATRLVRTMDVYVREQPDLEWHVFGVYCNLQNGTEIKVVTESDIICADAVSDNDKVELAPRDLNGFTVWEGTINPNEEYMVFINGVAFEEKTVNTNTLGDVNLDGTVNSYDALLTLQFSVGTKTPTLEEFIRSDMNADGILNSADALSMLKISTGLIG